MRTYWLEKIKRILNWFKNKMKKETGITSVPSVSPSSSLPHPVSPSSSVSEATSVSSNFQDDLDKLTRELSAQKIQIEKTKKQAEKAERNAASLLEEIKQSKNFVYLGFLIMLLMIIGMILSYVEFIYSGSKNDDYKYNLTIETAKLQSNISILEKDVEELKSESEEKDDCLKSRRYWQYEECF